MRSDSLDFIFNSYFQNLRFPTFLELNADYNSNGHFTFNALRPVRFSRLLLLICIFTENNVRRENQGDQDRIAWNKIEFRVRFVQFCSISGPWSITNSGIAFAQYSKSFNLDFNHRDQNLREKQLYIFFIFHRERNHVANFSLLEGKKRGISFILGKINRLIPSANGISCGVPTLGNGHVDCPCPRNIRW